MYRGTFEQHVSRIQYQEIGVHVLYVPGSLALRLNCLFFFTFALSHMSFNMGKHICYNVAQLSMNL